MRVNSNTMHGAVRWFVLSLFLLPPALVFAAPGDFGNFVPLVSIPNVNYQSTNIVTFINSIFALVISIGAMLAVLRIATGGFKYMTSEALGEKGDARETIQSAVFGLILLLGSWLILYTINPQIVNLSALQFKALGPSGEATADIQQTVNDIQAELDKLIANPGTFRTKKAAKDFVSQCAKFGGTPAPIEIKYSTCYNKAGPFKCNPYYVTKCSR